MAAAKQNPKSDKASVDSEIDDELNQLLDSALADFGKDKPTASGASGGDGAGAGAGDKGHLSSAGDAIPDAFAEEFSDEMAKQFEDAMKSFMAEDPAMLQQIEKLAEAAGNSADSADAKKEFGDTLKETLTNLAQNTEGLQDKGGASGIGMEDEMMKMFSGMGMEGGGPDDGFMPMMQGMMKTLLSKDVLYPSLKEISDKYPQWLEDNKGKVPAGDYSNYSKQHDIIGEILAEFDKESEGDTDDNKKKHFETIMELMQRMQDLGQPPKEIVGDMAPGLEFDANGVPKLPGSPEGCSLM